MAQGGSQGVPGGQSGDWKQMLTQVMMAAASNGGGIQGILGKLGKNNQAQDPSQSGNHQSGNGPLPGGMGGFSGMSNGPIGNTCWDDAPDCAEKLALCFNPDYRDLVSDKCQKTCGVCTTGNQGGNFGNSMMNPMMSNPGMMNPMAMNPMMGAMSNPMMMNPMMGSMMNPMMGSMMNPMAMNPMMNPMMMGGGYSGMMNPMMGAGMNPMGMMDPYSMHAMG
ncbi:shK domain-like domain-containing protein [Ditylenchus destructor]|nr:shK domain-like domain-containing protein [Ditylenchus destructor]